MTTSAPTAVLPFTRAVFVLGVCLTVATGFALFLVPGRTADYWAWTIKAPPSAAFFGAGYIGAAFVLAAGARARTWTQARIVAVLAFSLTSLALLVTLRNTGPFAFEAGGVGEAVAWIWLAVYVLLPPLVLIAFVLQERAGGAHEYADATATPATRIVFTSLGTALAVVGVGLLVDWGWLTTRWPWPLPRLPAGIVGAWLCTYAAGFLWFSLRERAWSRVRHAVLPAALAVALDLVSAGRLWDDFDGDASTAIYIAALVLLLVSLVTTAWIEERRASRVAVA
jgi:hypothetical protein